MDMILIRPERRTMLFDAREADSDGVENRDGQDAYSYRRSRRHLERSRHLMVGVDLAEMEDKRRQQVSQEQASGVAHEDLFAVSEDVIDEEHRQ